MKHRPSMFVAPLFDEGSTETPSFSKIVVAIVLAVWAADIAARVAVGLWGVRAAPPGGVTLLPGLTWQDVAFAALAIVASHGRSMLRYALSRTRVNVGTPGGNVFADDERGEHKEREVVTADD